MSPINTAAKMACWPDNMAELRRRLSSHWDINQSGRKIGTLGINSIRTTYKINIKNLYSVLIKRMHVCYYLKEALNKDCSLTYSIMLLESQRCLLNFHRNPNYKFYWKFIDSCIYTRLWFQKQFRHLSLFIILSVLVMKIVHTLWYKWLFSQSNIFSIVCLVC